MAKRLRAPKKERAKTSGAATKKKAESSPVNPYVALVDQLKRQGALLRELVNTIRALHEYDRGIRQTASLRASVTESDTVQPVAIEFTKTSGPKHVRIKMLDTGHPSLAPGENTGKSDPRRPGEEVEASIEVIGNPGELAVISVKNARPGNIQLAAEPGETGAVGTVPFKVLG